MPIYNVCAVNISVSAALTFQLHHLYSWRQSLRQWKSFPGEDKMKDTILITLSFFLDQRISLLIPHEHQSAVHSKSRSWHETPSMLLKLQLIPLL